MKLQISLLSTFNRSEPTGIDYAVANFIPLPNTYFNPLHKLQIVLSQEVQTPLVIQKQHRPGPKDISYGIPPQEWTTVLKRVLENHESYRKVAHDYGVSRETIRRLIRSCQRREQARLL